MTKKSRSNSENVRKRRSIIELNNYGAKMFLLKQESYCTIDLPPYFRFDNLLKAIANELQSKPLSDLRHKRPRSYDHINHPLLHNKDGRYSWRPLELIHPALYVSLVDIITEFDNWELIRDKFSEFSRDHRIKCLSLPVESLKDERDKPAQISQWWETVEQPSIELSLDYEFIVHTDIVDCYASMYTHTIAWALHTKPVAKEYRTDKKLIGNIIDDYIQDMRQGQTNGIPQGSVLMDLIAEMILGYGDTELINKIECHKIENYKILRYRDDYRIFVNNPYDGEIILKCLTETMIDLGLKLNPAKTELSRNVIKSSIKDDKLSWMFRKQGDNNIQKHLLIIHDHSTEHPNSGSLEAAMVSYHKRISKIKKRDFKGRELTMSLISIVADITYHSPRTYRISAAILSCLLSFLDTESEKQEVIERIRKKFSNIPNTGHLDIWLQRVSHKVNSDIEFDEPLCELVRLQHKEIWNNDWISSKGLKRAIDTSMIIDLDKLESMPPIIQPKEIELFPTY